FGLPDRRDDADPLQVGAAAAVQLFAERAASRVPGFRVGPAHAASVAEICRRVDGLPLGWELAAAPVAVLPPETLLAHLTEALASVGSGVRDAPERQRTLGATVEWSYGLLGTSERRFLCRLAVFAG